MGPLLDARRRGVRGHLPACVLTGHRPPRRPVSFRDDGAAALDWVAGYLERVPELPVLATVEPGDIRARLPASPPDEGEPFEAVLRDLDEVLLPGITNWQHPRF